MKRRDILSFDFEPTGKFRLSGNGGLKQGDSMAKVKSEGHGAGIENLTLVKDANPAMSVGLNYVCGAQQANDIKARLEHYMNMMPLRRTFYSEFSIKLDQNFTLVEKKRPDGGQNWCCLHQWHQGYTKQSTPKSPPISLDVLEGTNNVLCWSVRSGDGKTGGSKARRLGMKEIALGRWYHFRVQWKVSPDAHGALVVQMSESKLPRDLTAKDLLFRYDGPIGYIEPQPKTPSDNVDHGPASIREQMGIYQGPHTDPKTHHGFCVDNVAIYELTQ